MMPNVITIDASNLDIEHICCAITDKKGETCVSSKKAWMKSQFANGLKFKKLDFRGKVFIEYIPAEKAWAPINAKGYIYINCLWVSGQYKGKGHSNILLDECIDDAKKHGYSGLVILSSNRKRAFLSDPSYLMHKGFVVCDEASPFFKLMYLPFKKDAPIPKFNECCKNGSIPEKGVVLYCTNQCPFISKFVPIVQDTATENGLKLDVRHIQSMEDAQSCPSPYTTYALFKDGKFLTNEILTDSKFKKLIIEG